MQSAYHNLLPTVDGVMQAPGVTYAARDVCCETTEGRTRLTLNIADAYGQNSKLKRWHRTISLERGRGIHVEDSYELSEAADSITLALLTPCDVEIPEPGVVVLRQTDLPQGRTTGAGTATVTGPALTLSVEDVRLSDSRLLPTWGEKLNRVVLRLERPPLRGRLHLDFEPDAT